MKRIIFAAILIFQSMIGAQAREIILSPLQIDTLGIATAALPSNREGELADIPASVVIPGNQLYTVSTPLSAMVERTLAGLGDNVKKGQLLAVLQSPALTEAQRVYLQAVNQALLASGNLARDEQLWQEGIIAESRLRASRSKADEANSLLTERRQALSLFGMSEPAIDALKKSQILSNRLEITSPINGVILERLASSGQRLEASSPLFKVAQLNPLALEIQAPLAAVNYLKVGMQVKIPSFGAEGVVSAIGRNLNIGNQSVPVRALINNGADNLRPGQLVEARIVTRPYSNEEWWIPNSAIVRVANQAMVFVRTPEGFRTNPVRVTIEGMQSSVVRGTFKGSEQIAVAGIAALKSALAAGGNQ